MNANLLLSEEKYHFQHILQRNRADNFRRAAKRILHHNTTEERDAAVAAEVLPVRVPRPRGFRPLY